MLLLLFVCLFVCLFVGVVLVSTPQDLSLSDARKGAEMFKKVNIPVRLNYSKYVQYVWSSLELIFRLHT